MGFISIVQGAALSREYRALVFARDAAGPLTARISSEWGTDGAIVRFPRATVSPPLARQLAARRIAAYQLLATGLAPERVYQFDFSDGGASRVSLTTYTPPAALPAAGMTIAVGTCFYEGFNMGPKLQAALQSVRLVERPLLQFWGGDNIYADVPSFGQNDTPHGHTLTRYLKYFEGSPGGSSYSYARALTPNYTTFDDHEFWNNYPEKQLWLSRSWEGNRDAYIQAGKECLDLFQASVNPASVADGRSFSFDLPPLSFFFADARSERTRHSDPARRMMTPGDLAALEAWALGLSGPGVLVIGQPWWTSPGGSLDYNPPDFEDEYRRVWRVLRDAPYDLLIVTGDVHHSRLLSLDLVGTPGRKVWEFTTSPASHIPSVLSTVGLGNSQDKGSVSPPGRVDGAGIQVSAHYYFGTSVPNTFGLLRFTPKPGGEVSVGAAFVDYAPATPVFPASERCSALPASGHNLPNCVATDLFTLRRR